MQTLWIQIKNVMWNVFNRPSITDIVDILIVAFLLYELLMLTRETRASAVLKGLVMLVLASWVSDLLGLSRNCAKRLSRLAAEPFATART